MFLETLVLACLIAEKNVDLHLLAISHHGSPPLQAVSLPSWFEIIVPPQQDELHDSAPAKSCLA